MFFGKNSRATKTAADSSIENGQGIAAVGNRLAKDDIIYSRHVLVGAAYMLGVHNRLQSGSYKLPQKVSAWQILQKLKKAESDTVTVQIIEGKGFFHKKTRWCKGRQYKGKESVGQFQTACLPRRLPAGKVSLLPTPVEKGVGR